MLRQYSEFLPSYLDGENVRRHSEVLEAEDMDLYMRVEEVRGWSDLLRRPVLVERVQSEPAVADFHIHVDLDTPIQKITVQYYKGAETVIGEWEYTEDSLTTKVTETITLQDNILPVMPVFIVTVTTYDGLTLRKGYPENDTPQNRFGAVFDHDPYLDIIGALCGIPRRLYKDTVTGYTVEDFERMYPAYFTKTMFFPFSTGVISEDDYYYQQRLLHYTTNRDPRDHITTLLETLYQWTSVETGTMKGRTTSLTDTTQPLSDTPTMTITRNTEEYINIDYTNMEEIINNYTPLTRPVILLKPRNIYLGSRGTVDTTVNYLLFNNIQIWWEDSDPDSPDWEEGYLYNAPYKIVLHKNDQLITIGEDTTDNTGTGSTSIGGLPPGDYTIHVEPTPEYEFYTTPGEIYPFNVHIDNPATMTLPAWQSKRYTGADTNQYTPPFIDEDIGAICTGRRGLCYTPILNLDIVDLTTENYKITATYSSTSNYQSIGVVQLKEEADGTATPSTKWVSPYTIYGADDPYNTHTLEATIIDGTLRYHIDGVDTEITQNLTGRTGMLYLTGYNIYPVSTTTQNGMYLHNARLDNIYAQTDNCTSLTSWLVTDTGTPAEIRNNVGGSTAVRPPSTSYQRVYWKYPLVRGSNSSIKFKVYVTANAVGIILGSLLKNGQDHSTNIKSWWGGLGSTNNWSDGPNNSQNRHGGTRMSYNTWHTIEFKLTGNLLQTYVDGVSVRDYTIPTISSTADFNNYFFIQFSGNGVNIRDVEYVSSVRVTDTMLTRIRNTHMAQF